MKIINWDRWQSFRKDRGAPPWIKVHRNLMSNHEWVQLTDAGKGQLVSIWILAGDKSGTIPDCPTTIQKMCLLDRKPNLNKFIDLGFLTSSGCQDDANMTHQRREEESRVEESKNTGDSAKQNNVPYVAILNLYHKTLPTLPKVEKLTAKRKGYIKQRWLHDLPDLEHWENYFDFVKQSKFLMGKATPVNGRKVFMANLEWLTNESNFVKISEENYHG